MTSGDGCRCGAHRQHQVFATLWYNPGMTLIEVSQRLKVSYDCVKQAACRMRRKGLANRCPECFRPTFHMSACSSCGFDGSEAGSAKVHVDLGSSSPVYRLQTSGGLGSATQYTMLGLGYGGINISHLVERPKDRRFERLKSRLWQGLKSKMPRDDVCEDAARMLRVEYDQALANYSQIETWRGFPDAVLARVWSRLVLFYPELPKDFPLALTSRVGKSDRVTGEVDILSPLFDGDSA